MEAAISRLCWLVALVLVSVSIASAQDLSLSGSLPFGAYFGTGEWTPMRADIRNRGDAEFDATVRFVPFDPTSPEYRVPLHISPRSRVRTNLYMKIRPGSENSLGRLYVYDKAGAQVARSEAVGRPIIDVPNIGPNGIPDAGLLLTLGGEASPQNQEMDPQGILDAVSALPGWTLVSAQIDAAAAPWSHIAYDGASVVQLQAVDPDDLAPVQRQALITYVRGGGVLLIAAPDKKVIEGSWVEPLLPVRIVGNREMNGLTPANGEKMPFTRYLPCTEAVMAEGSVVLADGQFVHAAYREHGLGRVVFTSFPPSAMVIDATIASRLWNELLGGGRQPVGVLGTGVAKGYGPLMEPMLGRQAPALSVALFAALGMVALLVVLHLAWRGPGRPKAFVVSLLVAVVVSIGFAVAAWTRGEADPLQQARLVIADVGEPGAFINEFSVISGPQQTISRAATDASVAVSPALIKQDRPVLAQFPMELELIDVKPQQANLVVQSQGVRPQSRAAATGRFTEQGLEISLQNDIGQPLESAQLVWSGHRMSLPLLPMGDSKNTVGVAQLRPADEFAAESGLTSQDQQHKGQIVRALLAEGEGTLRRGGAWPAILGFAKQWPALTSVEGTDGELDRDVVQALVRIPVRVVPSQPGRVRFDSMFTELLSQQARGLPYDAVKREFIRSAIQNNWLVGFEAPKAAGEFRPERATLEIDIGAAQHSVRLRKGQAPGGKTPTGMGTEAGEVVADLQGQVGAHSVTFDVGPGDYDANGVLWLRLEVQQTGGPGGLGVEPHWRINRFAVAMEGQIQP